MKPDFERVFVAECVGLHIRYVSSREVELFFEGKDETTEDGEPKYNRACYDVAAAIRAEKEKTNG